MRDQPLRFLGAITGDPIYHSPLKHADALNYQVTFRTPDGILLLRWKLTSEEYRDAFEPLPPTTDETT